jgi:DNA ligase-1
MERREMVMLAKPHDSVKHKTEGSYMSEKLDGMRCFWLPQTRGMNFQTVPFANTNKDERAHTCTGLWTRYGKPIFAPAWLIDMLPTEFALDGELYAGRGRFQEVMSVCKKHTPDDNAWGRIGFYVFDIPSYAWLLQPGRINVPNFAEKIIPSNVASTLGIRVDDPWYEPRRFENNWLYLSKRYPVAQAGDIRGSWGVLQQEQLPMNRFTAEGVMQSRLSEVISLGGEGLMLRRPHSLWKPIRSDEVLKVKRLEDAEGEVIGFKYGFGKLHQMIGSVRLRTDFGNGMVEFDMSGFADNERLIIPGYRNDANLNPGKYVAEDASVSFKLGERITFQYRELTDDGKPKEARFLRKREVAG